MASKIPSAYQAISTLFFVFVLLGCAQKGAVTGGVKDTEPPKIEESVPLNFSTQFSGNTIELKFDEFVKVSSLSQELLVSPPLKYELEYQVKGKKVIFTIKDTLLPNTTYLFNFGEAIKDYTEGNALDSNLIVFSTGDELDSLYIKGEITDAFTVKPEDDMQVMLYRNLADTAPLTTYPDFITRVNKKGKFLLRNLPEGRYRLFGLRDKNRSKTFDQYTEKIAFDTTVYLSADTMNFVSIRSFFENPTQQQLLAKRQVNYGSMNMVFRLPVEHFQMTPLNDHPLPFIYEWDNDRDSLFVWFTDSVDIDSLYYQVVINDTLIDTVNIRFSTKAEFEKKLKRNKKLKPLNLELKAMSTGKVLFSEPYVLKSNIPLQSLDLEKLIFSVGEDTLAFENIKEDWFTIHPNAENDSLRMLEVSYPFEKDHSYGITFLPGAIGDVFGLENDTIEFTFKTGRVEDYGKLLVNIDGADSTTQNFVFELLDAKEKVVLRREGISGTEQLEFSFLLPGNYNIRMVADANKNGFWDPGNYTFKTQAENMYYYPDQVNLKANWDYEVDWDFGRIHSDSTSN